MGFIDTIKARAKADKKTIVLPESEDRRTYEAAAQILKEDLANLIIIGSEEAVKKGSEGLDVSKATIVDPEKNEKTQAYVDKLVELRAKKGMTPEKARETILNDYTYYGVMMVKMGDADGLVSGACHSTANTLRPCLQFAAGCLIASYLCFLAVYSIAVYVISTIRYQGAQKKLKWYGKELDDLQNMYEEQEKSGKKSGRRRKET